MQGALVNTDPFAVSADEQAATSRRLEVLVGSGGGDHVVDLTDGAPRTGEDTQGSVEVRLAAMESTLERLVERVEALAAPVDRVEAASVALATAFGADLTALRRDLADALDEVRGQVEDAVGDANLSIGAMLDGQRGVEQDALGAVQDELKSGLADISRSLSGQFTAISGVTGTLDGGTERLVGAGQALLAYLGERDLWLERERDRMLGEVLDDFAQGLSGHSRRTLSNRVRTALDRRRDARDAERFRQGGPAGPALGSGAVPAATTLPGELTELAEPIAPLELSDDLASVVVVRHQPRPAHDPVVPDPTGDGTATPATAKPTKGPQNSTKRAGSSGSTAQSATPKA
jgi:hypothetical protein